MRREMVRRLRDSQNCLNVFKVHWLQQIYAYVLFFFIVDVPQHRYIDSWNWRIKLYAGRRMAVRWNKQINDVFFIFSIIYNVDVAVIVRSFDFPISLYLSLIRRILCVLLINWLWSILQLYNVVLCCS